MKRGSVSTSLPGANPGKATKMKESGQKIAHCKKSVDSFSVEGKVVPFEKGKNYDCVYVKGAKSTKSSFVIDLPDTYLVFGNDGYKVSFPPEEYEKYFNALKEHREKILKNILDE